MNWVSGRTDCGGVLSPDENGLRQLYNIKDGNVTVWQKLEADLPTDVLVGRFVFEATAFDLAIEWLDQHLQDRETKYLLLDEVGPLELSGGGWDAWLQNAVSKIGEKTLILVVREGLVEKVVERYGITNYEVVGKEFFVEAE
jgi:nucleoside-triphosphatase THEP1